MNVHVLNLHIRRARLPSNSHTRSIIYIMTAKWFRADNLTLIACKYGLEIAARSGLLLLIDISCFSTGSSRVVVSH